MTISTADGISVVIPSTTLEQDCCQYYMSANQVGPAGVLKAIAFDTKIVDTQGTTYNSSTNRHTPTKPGYYLYNLHVIGALNVINGTAYTVMSKNGTEQSRSYHNQTTANTIAVNSQALVYMNGTTDYMEFKAYITGIIITGGLPYTKMTAVYLHS